MNHLAARSVEFAEYDARLRAKYGELAEGLTPGDEAAAARGEEAFLDAQDRLRRLLDPDLGHGADNVLREITGALTAEGRRLKGHSNRLDELEKQVISGARDTTDHPPGQDVPGRRTKRAAGSSVPADMLQRNAILKLHNMPDAELYRELEYSPRLRALTKIPEKIIEKARSNPERREFVLAAARFSLSAHLIDVDYLTMLENNLAQLLRRLRRLNLAQWAVPAVLLVLAVVSAVPGTMQLRPETLLALTAVAFIAQQWLGKRGHEWHQALLRRELPAYILKSFEFRWRMETMRHLSSGRPDESGRPL